MPSAVIFDLLWCIGGQKAECMEDACVISVLVACFHHYFQNVKAFDNDIYLRSITSIVVEQPFECLSECHSFPGLGATVQKASRPKGPRTKEPISLGRCISPI